MDTKVNTVASDLLQLDETDQIGLIRKRCVDQGIVSVSEIADACEAGRAISK